MGHLPGGLRGDPRGGHRAPGKSLRDVQNSWVKDMKVIIEDGTARGYNVNLEVTFVLDDET